MSFCGKRFQISACKQIDIKQALNLMMNYLGMFMVICPFPTMSFQYSNKFRTAISEGGGDVDGHFPISTASDLTICTSSASDIQMQIPR